MSGGIVSPSVSLNGSKAPGIVDRCPHSRGQYTVINEEALAAIDFISQNRVYSANFGRRRLMPKSGVTNILSFDSALQSLRPHEVPLQTFFKLGEKVHVQTRQVCFRDRADSGENIVSHHGASSD